MARNVVDGLLRRCQNDELNSKQIIDEYRSDILHNLQMSKIKSVRRVPPSPYFKDVDLDRHEERFLLITAGSQMQVVDLEQPTTSQQEYRTVHFSARNDCRIDFSGRWYPFDAGIFATISQDAKGTGISLYDTESMSIVENIPHKLAGSIFVPTVCSQSPREYRRMSFEFQTATAGATPLIAFVDADPTGDHTNILLFDMSIGQCVQNIKRCNACIVAWHPTVPHLLAYGTRMAEVGVIDIRKPKHDLPHTRTLFAPRYDEKCTECNCAKRPRKARIFGPLGVPASFKILPIGSLKFGNDGATLYAVNDEGFGIFRFGFGISKYDDSNLSVIRYGPLQALMSRPGPCIVGGFAAASTQRVVDFHNAEQLTILSTNGKNVSFSVRSPFDNNKISTYQGHLSPIIQLRYRAKSNQIISCCREDILLWSKSANKEVKDATTNQNLQQDTWSDDDSPDTTDISQDQ